MGRAGKETDKEMKPNEHRGGLYEGLERKIKSSARPHEWDNKSSRRSNGLRDDELRWAMSSARDRAGEIEQQTRWD
jgi:hypothetical protein